MFCFDDINLAALNGNQHLLRADIWFSEAMLFGGNEKLFTKARAAGLAVSIDLNWDPQWGVAAAEVIAKRKAAVRSVLPLVDLVHGNITELNAFAEESDLTATLHKIETWGARAVVVHMGDQGAGYFKNGSLIRQPCVPARQRVNATGTGDLLSVCMMLLDSHSDVPANEKLRLANTIVSEYIEGKRPAMTGLE
jgi:sugar/nucleoside kinase (ribokinase family)